MRDIRFYLWDIFVYLGVGSLVAIVGIFHAHVAGFQVGAIVSFLERAPWATSVGVGLIVLMLTGALIEPFASLWQMSLMRIVRSVRAPVRKRSGLERYIKEQGLVPKGVPLFPVCKEFVETRQLSTTYMAFLARYGFYRSCAFVFFLAMLCAGVGLALGWFSIVQGTSLLAINLTATLVFAHRSRQFLGYQAPAIFSAFLIPEIDARFARRAQADDGPMSVGVAADIVSADPVQDVLFDEVASREQRPPKPHSH